MSQPRQPTPTQSPTPSKSSLRRTSGTQNPSQRSLVPSPSPRFEEQPPAPVRYSPRSPPNQTLEYESDEDDEPLIYPDIPTAGTDESYFPYPEPEHPFQPFFTLVEDSLNSEHHHPSVHYIFADDDTELITEAALRSLEQDEIGNTLTAEEKSTQQRQSRSDSYDGSRLPPPRPGVREHYLILDVHPISQAQAHIQAQQQQSTMQMQSQTQSAGQSDFIPSYTIASFASLSPDWQISSASITSAPTMGDTPSEDEGLMLRIEGRGVPPLEDLDLTNRLNRGAAGHGDDKDPSRAREREPVEDMIERFQSQLADIKKLIEIDGGLLYRETGISAPGQGGDGAVETGNSEGRGFGYGLEEQD